MTSDWANARAESSRELIALARQGGSSLDEIRERRRATIAAAKDQAAADAAKAAQLSAKKSGKGSAGKSGSGMSRSASAPGLQQARSTAKLPGLTAAQSTLKSTQGMKTLSSTQGLQSTLRSTTGQRRGGGWATKEGFDELEKMKEKIDEILTNKSDIDYCEAPYKRTALWEASWKNHEAIVRLLHSKGASISHADHQGRTPLHEAAYYGHLNLLQFLIDNGHPIDCADLFGQTPLFRAVEGGRHDAVRLLVQNGAHTNGLDAHGVTVQHVAAFGGEPLLAQYLLHKGAYRHRFSKDECVGSPAGGSSLPDLHKAKGKRIGLGSKSHTKSALKAGVTLMFN